MAIRPKVPGEEEGGTTECVKDVRRTKVSGRGPGVERYDRGTSMREAALLEIQVSFP